MRAILTANTRARALAVRVEYHERAGVGGGVGVVAIVARREGRRRLGGAEVGGEAFEVQSRHRPIAALALNCCRTAGNDGAAKGGCG